MLKLFNFYKFQLSDSSPRGGVAKTLTTDRLTESKAGRLKVELLKGTVGLGFCIEGGKGSPFRRSTHHR